MGDEIAVVDRAESRAEIGCEQEILGTDGSSRERARVFSCGHSTINDLGGGACAFRIERHERVEIVVAVLDAPKTGLDDLRRGDFACRHESADLHGIEGLEVGFHRLSLAESASGNMSAPFRLIPLTRRGLLCSGAAMAAAASLPRVLLAADAKTIVWGKSIEMAMLDPHTALVGSAWQLQYLLVYDALVQMGDNFEPLPGLAQRWETPTPTK